MNWSWRVGKISGIDVYLHFTFLILLGWVALSHYYQEGKISQAITGLLFVLSLFGIVVLHELGHALAARRFGIQTRDITLFPIGGVARLERIPERPPQELIVALAGPAVNVVLAVALYIGIAFSSGLMPLGQTMRVGGSFVDQLFWVNVSLAVFNLLPAFPMDGGRVLRAILAMRMEYVQATQIAAKVGQAMALVFGFLGLFTNPFLLFIAFFVWMGATQEASMAQIRAAISGIPVSRAMITDVRALALNDTLEMAAGYVLGGFQQDFPVLENDRVVGLLTRTDLITGLSQGKQFAPVSDFMQRDFQTAEADEMLETVFSRFQEQRLHSLPVVHDSKLVGLITAENLTELLMIREAMREAKGQNRRFQI